jgi:acyl carrier protein
MENGADMRAALKAYILKEFLPGENPDELTETTPLVTGGVLDSLATLKLVSFIEDRYRIELQAHDVDVEHLNTISDIVSLVQTKQK